MGSLPYKPQSEYSKKLLDPRWQKKRLEILNRDEFACVRCGDSENTLHVHHRVYKLNADPWEYENNQLVTLCCSCHEEESEFLKFAPKHLSNSFLEAGFFACDFISIIEGLREMELKYSSHIAMSAYGWAFSNEKMQAKILSEYSKYMSDMRKKRISANKLLQKGF